MTRMLESYVAGSWYRAADEGLTLVDATTAEPVAQLSAVGPDSAAAVEHARRVGGPALRALTFPERAALVKAVAGALSAAKDELYALSTRSGATRADSAVDIDGGIGTLAVYASKGRKELPAGRVIVDGALEPLGRDGTFAGQHIRVPLSGVAVQINAYNFPVWGPSEKLATALLAGVPSIVKPAGQTAYLTELAIRRVIESGVLPEGALQLVCGGGRSLLDQLGGQDLISFTGSADTAALLRGHDAVSRRSARFNAEADSLNASVLGLDAAPGTPEFDLFVTALVYEMTAKSGQKCTAIRRALVPAKFADEVAGAISERLARVTVGNPALPEVDMGPLVSTQQRDDVRARFAALRSCATVVFGDPDQVDTVDADAAVGAFLSPLLLRCDDTERGEPHEIEAFGPVSTMLPYRDAEHAGELLRRGDGSLVASVVTHDVDLFSGLVLNAGSFHGRLLHLDRDNAGESTGHGTPMPQLVHGGPGRAGGGEEEGGMRAVHHHMQRIAVQAEPRTLEYLQQL